VNQSPSARAGSRSWPARRGGTGQVLAGQGSVAGARGVTLIEVMAVMTILGLILLLVPPNLDTFGDQSRLQSAANTVASSLTAAREMAIIDGHEVRVQYELSGDVKDRTKTGRLRYIVASRGRQTPRGLEPEGTRRAREEEEPPPEEEWMETDWRGLPAGVQLQAFSEESGQWVRGNPGGNPIEISFLADGTVRPAHALRLVSLDVESEKARTVTVRVNALTSSAEVVQGEGELPRARDPNEFR
jgi:prepilin-type N-terminal cleavage/methylation domain-containing protein